MNTEVEQLPNKTQAGSEKHSAAYLLGKISLTLILLYLFLVGVSSLSGGLKMMGSDFAKTLFDLTGQPFIGLMAGMLATVLFQSSSVTTSIIVGLVSAGTVTISGAIPLIMGANLGTSVTNTLVSLGYLSDKDSFKRAFAAATVHDFFNILSVAILLPLELATGFIQKGATALSSLLYGTSAGIAYKSPIKAMIKPPVKALKGFLVDISPELAPALMIIAAGIIIISALTLIVKNMKVLVESNKSGIIDKVLSKNALFSIMFGAIVTISVQSSSITTSLLVPMAGAGVLTLEAIYPVTIGANIGTTATALLASMTGNIAGLTIALVHLIFNLAGMLLLFPIPALRVIPMKCSRYLAKLVEKSKMYGIAYIAIVFFIIPLTLIFLNR